MTPDELEEELVNIRQSIERISRTSHQAGYQDGYQEGFAAGLKQGHSGGFKEGWDEAKVFPEAA